MSQPEDEPLERTTILTREQFAEALSVHDDAGHYLVMKDARNTMFGSFGGFNISARFSTVKYVQR